MSFDPLYDNQEPVPEYWRCPDCPYEMPLYPHCDRCRKEWEVVYDL